MTGYNYGKYPTIKGIVSRGYNYPSTSRKPKRRKQASNSPQTLRIEIIQRGSSGSSGARSSSRSYSSSKPRLPGREEYMSYRTYEAGKYAYHGAKVVGHGAVVAGRGAKTAGRYTSKGLIVIGKGASKVGGFLYKKIRGQPGKAKQPNKVYGKGGMHAEPGEEIKVEEAKKK